MSLCHIPKSHRNSNQKYFFLQNAGSAVSPAPPAVSPVRPAYSPARRTNRRTEIFLPPLRAGRGGQFPHFPFFSLTPPITIAAATMFFHST
jgi:hypothetical protein